MQEQVTGSGNGQSTVIAPDAEVSPSGVHPDLKTIGLTQLIQEGTERVIDLERTRETVNKEEAATLTEFHTLSNIHDHPDRNLPGFEATTRPYFTEMAEAKRDRFYAIAAGLLAVAVGAYFSSKTLVAYSVFTLTVGCVVAATLLGALAAGVLSKLTDATPKNPGAKGLLRKITYITGGVVFGSVALFLFLRFIVDFDSPFLLPAVIVTMELGLIIVAAAFECSHNINGWSGPLNDHFHKLGEQKAVLISKIEAEQHTVIGLQTRLREHVVIQ